MVDAGVPGRAWCGSCRRRTAARDWARWHGGGARAASWPSPGAASVCRPPGCCSACGTPAAPRSRSPPGCILGNRPSGCPGWRCRTGSFLVAWGTDGHTHKVTRTHTQGHTEHAHTNHSHVHTSKSRMHAHIDAHACTHSHMHAHPQSCARIERTIICTQQTVICTARRH